jgi:uncharacterized Zn-finger protein
MAGTRMNEVKQIPATARNRHEVMRADVPHICPMPGMVPRCSHPRVYLTIEATGEARFPYCVTLSTYDARQTTIIHEQRLPCE